MISFTKKSMVTGREHTMMLDTTQEKLDQWLKGKVDDYIQEYFSELTDTEREFILTGTTEEEWDEIFPEEESEFYHSKSHIQWNEEPF